VFVVDEGPKVEYMFGCGCGGNDVVGAVVLGILRCTIAINFEICSASCESKESGNKVIANKISAASNTCETISVVSPMRIHFNILPIIDSTLKNMLSPYLPRYANEFSSSRPRNLSYLL